MKKEEIISHESELLLDCLDFEILIISEDFEILFANKQFLNKVASSREEVFGKHCYEITHHLNCPCAPPTDPCPLVKVNTTKRPSIELHTHYTKENKKVLVNVLAAPILLETKKKTFLHLTLPVKEGVDRREDIKLAMLKTMDVLQVIQTYQTKITELENTKKDLESKMTELEKFNKLTVGRELKMLELKKRLNELKKSI